MSILDFRKIAPLGTRSAWGSRPSGAANPPDSMPFEISPSTASLFIVENTPHFWDLPSFTKLSDKSLSLSTFICTFWKYLDCWHVHSEKVWSPSHPIVPLDLTPILSSPCLHLFHLGKGLSRKNAWIVRSDWPYGHHPFLGFVFKMCFQTGSGLISVRQTVTRVVEAQKLRLFRKIWRYTWGISKIVLGPQDLWVKNPSCAQFLIVWGVSFMGSIALPSGPQRGVQDA